MNAIRAILDFLLKLFAQKPQTGGLPSYTLQQRHQTAHEERTEETKANIGEGGEMPTGGESARQKEQEQQKVEAAFVVRPFTRTKDSTLSKLYYRNEFVCYILEDGVRQIKIQDRTAIFEGTYKIAQLRSGRFFDLYRKMFGHNFVPWLKGTAQFDAILIHIGNTILDTRGCLLTGTEYRTGKDGNYQVTQSKRAYKKVFSLIDGEIKQHGEAYIQIIR